MVTSDLVAMVGTAVLTVGGFVPFLKRHTNKIIKLLTSNAKPIATVANDAVQVVEDVEKIPALTEIKAKLAERETAFKNSELGRIASTALHAFEKGFNALSANEKATLVTLVRVELSKAGIDATDQEIVAELADAQRFTDVFKGTEAFRNTVALENSLKALSQATAGQPAVPVQVAQ